MKLAEALAIVYDLADQNRLERADVAPDKTLLLECAEQRIALDIVHDFIVNNFGEETNGQ